MLERSEHFEPQREDSIPNEVLVRQVADSALRGQTSDHFPYASEVIVFNYGQKQLFLAVDSERGHFGTFIKNVLPVDQKQPHETSILYATARRMMQVIAAEYDKPFDYRVLTKNKKIKSWAETAGRELFSWDGESDDGEVGNPLFVFRKNILPNIEKE